MPGQTAAAIVAVLCILSIALWLPWTVWGDLTNRKRIGLLYGLGLYLTIGGLANVTTGRDLHEVIVPLGLLGFWVYERHRKPLDHERLDTLHLLAVLGSLAVLAIGGDLVVRSGAESCTSVGGGPLQCTSPAADLYFPGVTLMIIGVAGAFGAIRSVGPLRPWSPKPQPRLRDVRAYYKAIRKARREGTPAPSQQ